MDKFLFESKSAKEDQAFTERTILFVRDVCDNSPPIPLSHQRDLLKQQWDLLSAFADLLVVGLRIHLPHGPKEAGRL